MTRLRVVLVSLCIVVGCDKSAERVTALETRIAELEKKQAESEQATAALGKLRDEHKTVADKVAAMQLADVQTADTLAKVQRDVASAQEQLAILAKSGTMSVEPGGLKVPASGEIGIPACDEYITKYMKCIEDKVPKAARETMNEAMAETVKAWKEAASGPAREGLATACEAALDAAKAATKSLGCEW